MSPRGRKKPNKRSWKKLGQGGRLRTKKDRERLQPRCPACRKDMCDGDSTCSGTFVAAVLGPTASWGRCR